MALQGYTGYEIGNNNWITSNNNKSSSKTNHSFGLDWFGVFVSLQVDEGSVLVIIQVNDAPRKHTGAG